MKNAILITFLLGLPTISQADILVKSPFVTRRFDVISATTATLEQPSKVNTQTITLVFSDDKGTAQVRCIDSANHSDPPISEPDLSFFLKLKSETALVEAGFPSYQDCLEALNTLRNASVAHPVRLFFIYDIRDDGGSFGPYVLRRIQKM